MEQRGWNAYQLVATDVGGWWWESVTRCEFIVSTTEPRCRLHEQNGRKLSKISSWKIEKCNFIKFFM